MTTTTDPTLTGNTDPTLTDATSFSSTTTAPVLALDQASADYSPGQTVGITASNVAVGGSVTFDVEHALANGTLAGDLTGTGTPWTVTDGGPGDLDGVANGVIQTSWYVNNDAFGQAFVLTAADPTSGQVATTNFTDAKLSSANFAYSDPSATGIDMTTASAAAGNFVTLNHGVFGTDVPLGNVSGSGQFQPFVRIQANSPQEEGYNSTAIDNATIQFHGTTYADDLNNSSNNPAFSPTLTLSKLGNVIISGTPYYEFFLDANQANSKSLISLDSVQIFQSTNNALGTTSTLKFDPQAIEGGTGTGFGSNATLVWDLDATGDKSIMIDTNIAGSGSGRPDFALLLPQSLFHPVNGNYIYFYSSFGGHTQSVANGSVDGTNTSGFEEWSAFTGTTAITPSLTITKTATIHDGGATVDAAGDVIDYVITVHNTGNINLTSVNVTDQLEAGFTGTPGTLTLFSGDTSDPGVLDVGETWVYHQSYTVSAADITSFGVDHDGFVDNTATVTTAQTPTPQSATAQVPVFGANPAISILKTVTSVTDANHDGKTDAGDVINYNIHVANTGNVTLTGLTVTDPLTGNPVSAGTLAVGGFEDLAASYTITQADVDNHGVNAFDPTADNKITNTATANSNEAGPVSSSVDTPDRKSTRLNSSHLGISYAVFCL